MKRPGRFWKVIGIFMLIIAVLLFVAYVVTLFTAPNNKVARTVLLVSAGSGIFIGMLYLSIGVLLNDVHASKVFLANLLRIKLEERGEYVSLDIKDELK